MALTNVALRAADFLGTIGVNTHISWQDSGSAYTNQTNISNALAYLGVNYVRDGVPYEGWTLPFYQQLASAGIKFNLITTSTEFNKTGSFSTDLGHIASLAKAAPGSIASIEGLNEINTWTVTYNGQNTGSNLAVARDVQALLYSQVHADPTLANIPVLNLTLGGMTAQQGSVMGDMSNLADFGTWHTYFGNGDQPGALIASGIASAKVLDPADPVQITETNYYTAVDDMSWGGGGVTEIVQAKFDLNLLMDAAKGGVARTYLYELLDNNLSPTNTIEGSLGLFHSDGSPKLAATAIHNLTTILADGAANATSFTTAPLDFSVSGLASNGKTMLLQKSDGHYDLVIWAEPDIWNEATRSAIAAPNQAVTITLGSAVGSIKVYDPLTGTSAIATASNTGSITVQVSDHPLILDISGTSTIPVAPVSPPPAAVAPAATAIGSGSDTLVLKISQDAWNGDAQYTISIDGVQQGGTLTAKALHGVASDTVTVKGDWAAGSHTVAVNFLNDAYGGTASTDRNLYVDAITYNGTGAGSATALMSAGAKTFTVNDATALPNATVPANTTIGSGSDTLVLKISEDAWNGDAQYTISIDGVQQGGTLTAKALHGVASDTVTVKGDWTAGSHTVSVNFLNDAYGGTASTDRNLYVDAITYNGATAGKATALMSTGAAAFTVSDTTALPNATVPANTTIGSGSDTLVLKISQEAWNGDAQYTIKVDGVQQGGILTAKALFGSGTSDTVTVKGDWGLGNHNVAVTFLNDAYGGTASTDRNLHIDSVSYNGVVSGSATAQNSNGTANFTVVDKTSPTVTVGSGTDTVALKISQDAWNGDAQYVVMVDGVQVGGTLTAHAAHGSGQYDQVLVKGSWAAGDHTLAVKFLNDAYGGTAATDRNLYVDGVTYDGQVVSTSSTALMSNGTVFFTLHDTTAPSVNWVL